MLRTPVIGAFLAGSLVGAVFGQTEHRVSIDSVSVSLGMSEKEALAKLSRDFELRSNVQEAGNMSSWQVLRKGEGAIANVWFERRALRGVRIYWLKDAQAQEGGAPAAGAILGILSRDLEKSRWHNCNVQVDARQTPDGGFRTATIYCGQHGVELSVSKTKFGEHVTVDEMHQISGQRGGQ